MVVAVASQISDDLTQVTCPDCRYRVVAVCGKCGKPITTKSFIVRGERRHPLCAPARRDRAAGG